ncbi:B-cell receptor CD22-like [Epinephelus lanceolatus]
MKRDQESFYHHFYPKDSYSCALKGHEDVHSPLVCVHGQSCNRVTYTDRSICAFKGSSVDISCTYKSYEDDVESKLWFSSKLSDQQRYNMRPKDVSKDSQYDHRVDIKTRGGHSTLRITNLRESDSAQYRFKFKAGSFEWENSLPGTTLTVTDPDLQVQVIWSPAGPKLICHSSCLPSGHFSFIWYKNQTEIQGETSVSYGGYVNLADSYSCAYQSYRSPPVYAPKVPTLLTSSSGDIMKDDLVTLTCSSDANPAAKYTWYKKNQTPLSEGPQHFFSSIQSSDSGEYYCAAENELGRRSSEYVIINVQYAPNASSVSVSPSAEIVEGSSVTLTCSSDANPAAKYTWYKENQTLLEGKEDIFFTSISSEDSGSYHCKSENRHGRINSTSLVLDVQYAPKLPSVSVSPSAEIVDGSSVTLTCSSDANPAANYTWYKEDEDSPKASGQIFTITDIRAEHSGNYYREAQNTRGRQISTLHLTVVAGAWKLAAAGTISCVLLAILAVLAVFLWIRRKKALTQQYHGGERPDNGPQLNMGPVYDVPSAAAQTQPAEQQDELHYSSISFPQNQEEALYSNVRPAQPHRHEDEDSGVEYTAIKTESASGAPGTRRQEDGEDLFALYSTVKK